MWNSSPLLVAVTCAVLVVGTSGDLVDRLLASDYYFDEPAPKSRQSTTKVHFKEKWCLVRCRETKPPLKPYQSCEEDEIVSKPQYKSSEEVFYSQKPKTMEPAYKPSQCEPIGPPYVTLVKSYKPPEQVYKGPNPTKKSRVVAEIIYKPSKISKQPVEPCNENYPDEDQPYVTYV